MRSRYKNGAKKGVRGPVADGDRSARGQAADRRGGAAAAGRPGWLRARWPALRFALLLGLFMGLFYALTVTHSFREGFYPAFIRANAGSAAAILRMLGEDARSVSASVISPRFSLGIRRGCEGLEPTALYVAAVLAFRGPWRRRAAGVVAGILVLAIVNVLRIVSLYYVGVFAPGRFEMVHVAVWQPVYIAVALALWVSWAIWATRGREQRSHAAS